MRVCVFLYIVRLYACFQHNSLYAIIFRLSVHCPSWMDKLHY